MQLSLLVAQYQPDAAALRRTLSSIAMQTAREFEVVLADDGSELDYFEESRAYLAAHGITAVQCAKMQPNGGTVANILNAAECAAGDYVVTISPGDYFYDAETVAWYLEVIRREAPRAAFGRQACYRLQGGVPVQCAGGSPFDRSPYTPARFDGKKARRNLLLYDDGISGAGMLYQRGTLCAALEMMQGHVKFAEDFAVRLFAVQGVPVAGYDRPCVWYEVGSGVSTAKTEQAEARMLADWRAMVALLRSAYPHDATVKLAHAYFFNDQHRSRLVRGLVGRLIVPQNCAFKKAQKAWQPPVTGDLSALQAIFDFAAADSAQAAGTDNPAD